MIEHIESYENVERENNSLNNKLYEKFKPDTKAATDRSGEWVEIGHQNISVDRIDVSDTHVHSENDFSKTSFEDMQKGLGILEKEVRPLVDQRGVGKEYFEQLDRSQPLDGNISRTKIYNAFYEKEHHKIDNIRVAKVGDSYKLENGYHRVYVAQKLGMRSLPALVKVRV